MQREWKTESKGEKHARKSRRLKVVTVTMMTMKVMMMTKVPMKSSKTLIIATSLKTLIITMALKMINATTFTEVMSDWITVYVG